MVMTALVQVQECTTQLMHKSLTGSAINLPFQEDIYLVSLWVAGTRYYQAAKVADRLSEGQPLRLRRQPDNPHDKLAIEVLTEDGVKLGYIPRHENAILARLMDAGKHLKARVRCCKQEHAALEVRVRVHMENL